MVDAFELAPAERKFDFDVDGRLGVVGKFFVLVNAEEVVGKFKFFTIVFDPLFLPVFEPLHAVFAIAEEFHFHLGEFAAAEGEVARIDLIAERLADLGDPERQLLAGGDAHRMEVDENRLAGFGAQVGRMLLVENRPDEGFHHQVEFARFGQVFRAAVRAGGRVFHLVDAVAALAFAAVGHQIAELVEVAGSLPHPRVADDGRVESFDIVAGFDHFVPPERFHRALHPRAVGAVIPEAVDAAIDFGTRKNESAPLAQRYDFFHQHIIFFLGHFLSRFPGEYMNFILKKT
ncbi:hypothetical protein SDC9_102389 [bioreactor metagenome]|uniref:Uncharacterized protein n=1 Tax=bioreactor metagenome TaxID=1076179 RepID=A0A645AQQ4_9ZZZZ